MIAHWSTHLDIAKLIASAQLKPLQWLITIGYNNCYNHLDMSTRKGDDEFALFLCDLIERYAIVFWYLRLMMFCVVETLDSDQNQLESSLDQIMVTLVRQNEGS